MSMPIPERFRGTASGSVRCPLDTTSLRVAKKDMLSENVLIRNKLFYMLGKMIHYGGIKIEGLDVVQLADAIAESYERYPQPSAERDYLVAQLMQHAVIAEKMYGSPECHCRYDLIKADMEVLIAVYHIDCDRALRIGHLLQLGIRTVDLDDFPIESNTTSPIGSPPPSSVSIVPSRPWGPSRVTLPKLRKCNGCGLFGYKICAWCNRS